MGEERVRMRKKQEKKHGSSISRSVNKHGGNGIGGLVVFGGAIAIAGFIALASFVTNRRNKKKTKGKGSLTPIPQQLSLELKNAYCKSLEDHQIQINNKPTIDSTNDADGDAACEGTSNTTSVNQISPFKLLSPLTNIILEEEKVDSVPDLNSGGETPNPNCFHHQEIVLSDDYSHPDSLASSVEEECLASLLDSSNSKGQEAQAEHQQCLNSGEEEKEQTEEYDLENCEQKDISEEILNQKAVLPEEQDFKEEEERKIHIKREEAKGTAETYSEENDTGGNGDASHYAARNKVDTVNEKGNSTVVQNLKDQPSALRSFRLGNFLMPMLLLLLLVLLVCHTQQKYSLES